MSKYIDADRLMTFLKKKLESYKSKMVDPSKHSVNHIDLMAFLAREYQALILQIESLQQEQHASDDLEKEIEDYIEGCLGGLVGQEIASCARYFYDLGCRHTAVMYDDIEYNRQREEETKISKGLEEEIHEYNKERFDEYFPEQDGDFISEVDFMTCLDRVARYFAEWGRKQVLQEIYDGKVKPVDKITAAWLED